MSRIDRRSMLKAMAATAAGAAGAAVGGTGLQSVLAASPNPTGPVTGTHVATRAGAPRVLATTAGTTYDTYPGSKFWPGASTYTWADSGGSRTATNGGFYTHRIQAPQGVTLTEISFFIVNPTTTPSCFGLLGAPDGTGFSIFASGAPAAPSGTVQKVDLTVTPTTVDNGQFWYEIDLETGAATDVVIEGARVGWIHQPGLSLFPNPRRIVSQAMTYNTSYGPFDATTKVGGGASGVPAGAQAAFCAVQSYSPGVLTLFPDGTADTHTANYSGTGTAGSGLNMLYMLVPLSAAGKFRIHSYITGNVYVDVWGFLV